MTKHDDSNDSDSLDDFDDDSIELEDDLTPHPATSLKNKCWPKNVAKPSCG